MARLLILLVLITLAGCNLTQSPQQPIEQIAPPVGLTCDELVSSALATVGSVCSELTRNQACYGNRLVEAAFQPEVRAVFGSVGDIVTLTALQAISTSPLDEEQQIWGVALLKAQANLPGNLPGQNVTFLLYGGALLDNVAPDMQAVIINTGIGGISCAEAPTAAVIIQSPGGTQVNLKINDANVSLASTLYLTATQNDTLRIATIEGMGVVEAFGVTRVVNPGSQVSLPLNSGDGLLVSGPPSEPEPFDLAEIQRAPLSLLERPVQIPQPLILPTIPTSSSTPSSALPITSTLPPVTLALPATATSAPCFPRTDWTATYTVQSGDTLFSIAQRFNLSLPQLQSGNCIADANQIFAGQVLRVPFQPPTSTSTPVPPTPTLTTVPIQPTLTPTDANFRADDAVIDLGECTTLRWDVQNVQSVSLDGQTTTASGSQQVCPKTSARYTLNVVHPDGKQLSYFVSITVNQPQSSD